MNTTLEKVQDFTELSLFLAKMNGQKESHIGFCGQNPEEILQTLKEDFIEKKRMFHFSLQKISWGKLWGPFNQKSSMEVQDKLWEALKKANPTVHTYSFFINKENVQQRTFMDKIGAEEKGEHLKLLITKQVFDQVQEIKSIPFEQGDFKAFEQLHNETFPNTYYDAKMIVKRRSDENILKVLKNEFNELQGYTYFEIDTDMSEASLEYIGISKAIQNKGLGTMLLKEAVSEMFAFPNIKEIALVVENVNSPANHMYMKAGFKQGDILINYQL